MSRPNQKARPLRTALVASLTTMLAAAAPPPSPTNAQPPPNTLTVGTETLHVTPPDHFKPENSFSPPDAIVNYVYVIDGDMDLRHGGLQIRARPVQGNPTVDQLLTQILARNGARCPTKVAVDDLRHFTDNGLPALTVMLRCGSGNTERPGSIVAMKLIRGKKGQFMILRVWETEPTALSNTLPITDEMRTDATAVLDSAHVCKPGAPCP